MLSGVSHDLRTPITRMKLQLAMLPEDSETAELKDDIAEMERMIEGYLTFARGEGDEPTQKVDLGLMVEDIVSVWRRNGVKIDCHVEGTLTAWLRPDAIKRGIENLVANASRYGGQLWVRAGRRGDAIEITVDDDGPGIPESHREDVFRPFYRLDESRNPETGGTGLGPRHRTRPAAQPWRRYIAGRFAARRPAGTDPAAGLRYLSTSCRRREPSGPAPAIRPRRPRRELRAPGLPT